MKALLIVLLIFIISFLSGCWVPVEDETTQPQNEQQTPEHIQCFNDFKNACQQGQWHLAYQCLSSDWRRAKTQEQFAANMKTVGLEHLDGVRIITQVKTENNGIEKWSITTLNKNNNATQFVFIKEADGWKLLGVKNLKNKS